MTMGGTASNLLGLLLARDRAGENVRRDGLPPQRLADRRLRGQPRQHPPLGRAARPRHRGRDRRRRPTRTGALSLEAFDAATDGQHVIAVVGTAGHDRPRRDRPARGARRPRGRARRLVPRRRRRRLRPRPQPAPAAAPEGHRARRTASPPTCTSCGGSRSAPARCSSPTSACCKAVHHASVYLNRPEDEAEGQLNLVGRTLDTSRRFDALKVLIALRATGRRRLAEMIDQVLELAQYAGDAIERRPELELLTRPSTVMVAFRHRGDDATNIRIHRDLFASGRAVIGRTTRRRRRSALKLTLLNPHTTPQRHRRAAGRDRQRGSLTGSFTLRASPAALRTRPVIQTVLSVPRGLAGSRSRRRTHLLGGERALHLRPGERALAGAQRRRAGAPPASSPGRRRAAPACVRLRSSRGVARAVRNGAPWTSTGGRRGRDAAPARAGAGRRRR